MATNGPFDSGKKTDYPYLVMIVDDSSVIRNILKRILKDAPDIEVIGEADNGKIAIERAHVLRPDIILLDIEMPVMDGLSALPQILQVSPLSQVIMVSTLTDKNAEISVKAMNLGAADYLQKPEAGVDKDIFKTELLEKIQALGLAVRDRKNHTQVKIPLHSKPITETRVITPQKIDIPVIQPAKTAIIKAPRHSPFKPLAIAIASSTGGPQALQILFEGLKNCMPDLPIFITQHMPPVFTKYLAGSLSKENSIKCHEAQDGMEVLPGNVYLAPGNFHMQVISEGAKIKIKLNQNEHENFCRPAADPMLRSLMEVYGSKVLVVVLTGMGQDGLQGAKLFAEKGGIVIAQDQASSVVWGMPGAVCEAGITSGVYPIEKIADRIIEICAMKLV